MTRRLKRHDDSGAALILVLVVVTILAVGLGALLSFADTSVRATINLRSQGAAVYNADGAAQAAINSIRKSSYNGAPGQHCFGAADTLSLPGFNGSDSAAVSCAADPTRVLIQCPSLSHCNRPGSAILTLGQIAGEDGVNIQQPTGSALRVHGAVFSNSNINVVNGSLETNTAVHARGACAGTIQSDPSPPSCNYGTTANPLGDDPGYAPATASVPAYQALPACTNANSVVTFQPGYYDDAKGLSDMMAGNSACRHSTWWFKPGVYYFDFHNSGANPNATLNAGPNVWTVDDGYLVAGTPAGPTGAPIASPPVPAAIPGSCVNPIDTPTAVGVQFIFGGDSQFSVKSGQAEICGTYSTNRPPVAIYGLKTGAETTTALTGANTLKATSATASGGFTNAAAATELEGTYAAGTFASWTTNSNSNGQVGQVQLGGFATSVPAGANLVAARLRVGHRYTPQSPQGARSESLSVRVAPNVGPAFTVPVPSYSATSPAAQTDTIDVTAQLASSIHTNGFSGAAMTYGATVGQKGTEDLDGIQLDLTYIAPAFRAGSGCVTTGPYTGTGSSSCALVTSVNNSGNQFYIQGTTYAPNAAVDITLNNAAEQVFRFGVITRTLSVKLTGSFHYGGVVIEVPDDSPGFVFSVYLSVYVCPGSGSCTPGGSPALRAKVAFVDADPVSPVPGRRQVVVLSWSSTG